MTDVAQFLMERYKPIPSVEVLEQAIFNHYDKFIVVREKEIKGVAIYLLLTDESYEHLDTIDITNVEVVITLLGEKGRNLHFILLAASDMKTILTGLRQAVKLIKPKTVSWWDPTMSRLHKYIMN